ncbi:hypothetical protein AAY473_027789 [Plecturocebus cupreus]
MHSCPELPSSAEKSCLGEESCTLRRPQAWVSQPWRPHGYPFFHTRAEKGSSPYRQEPLQKAPRPHHASPACHRRAALSAGLEPLAPSASPQPEAGSLEEPMALQAVQHGLSRATTSIPKAEEKGTVVGPPLVPVVGHGLQHLDRRPLTSSTLPCIPYESPGGKWTSTREPSSPSQKKVWCYRQGNRGRAERPETAGKKVLECRNRGSQRPPLGLSPSALRAARQPHSPTACCNSSPPTSEHIFPNSCRKKFWPCKNCLTMASPLGRFPSWSEGSGRQRGARRRGAAGARANPTLQKPGLLRHGSASRTSGSARPSGMTVHLPQGAPGTRPCNLSQPWRLCPPRAQTAHGRQTPGGGSTGQGSGSSPTPAAAPVGRLRGAGPRVTRAPPRAKLLGPSEWLRVRSSPAPGPGSPRGLWSSREGHVPPLPLAAVPLTWEQAKMNSGFRSMSCRAVTQLRTHFLTVSLKGQSQARWGAGGGPFTLEGPQVSFLNGHFIPARWEEGLGKRGRQCYKTNDTDTPKRILREAAGTALSLHTLDGHLGTGARFQETASCPARGAAASPDPQAAVPSLPAQYLSHPTLHLGTAEKALVLWGILRFKRGKNLLSITQVLLGHIQVFKDTPASPASPTSCCPTCINVAVPCGMNGVLAFTSTLAKEPGGQGLGHREGLGLGRVTHVHHLVGRVRGLEAALAVLPEALQEGPALNPLLKHGFQTIGPTDLLRAQQRVPGGTGDVSYLGYVQKQLQIHQEIVDIPVEHSQLSLAQLEHLLRVRRCNHASLPGPQEPIAGHFHIEGSTTQRIPQYVKSARGRAVPETRDGSHGLLSGRGFAMLPKLVSSDLPTSASQNAGITSVSHVKVSHLHTDLITHDMLQLESNKGKLKSTLHCPAPCIWTHLVHGKVLHSEVSHQVQAGRGFSLEELKVTSIHKTVE